MNQRRAIIFDMDGLMVDTEPMSRKAWAQLLADYGHRLDDETYGRMIGHRIDVGARIALEAFPIPLTIAEIIGRKSAISDRMRAGGVPVMPGLMELQDEIARINLPWGVATSSPRHHAEVILEQLGLSHACGAVAGGDEVPSGKPAPDIYLLAAERLGVPPDRCLALEDSLPGSQAAVSAGMHVVAIPNGQTLTANFHHVHHLFSSLHDVLANLESLLNMKDGSVSG